MKKKEKNKEKPKTAMNFLKYSLVCYCLSVISMIVGGEIIVNDSFGCWHGNIVVPLLAIIFLFWDYIFLSVEKKGKGKKK